jgi:antagonist of KipI
MTAVFNVVQPGLLTTVQDLGRPGAIASGVPPGGAMDRFAHAAANLLVGNERTDATLECTLGGPQLVALRSCLVAVTGADLGLQVNGREAPMWTGIFLATGDSLSFTGRRSGIRAYVGVSGGFDGERWLGSRSTYLLVSRGGIHGRALKAGDELHVAADRSAPMIAGRQLAPGMLPGYSDHTLAVMAGPHLKRLESTSRKALFDQAFKVTSEADRMGYRLDGPTLALAGDELLSFGLAAGSVQVVNSGQAIMLMADHQTAGGYAVVATAVSASLPVAAQLGPGDELSFRAVTESQARSMRHELSAALASLASP